MNKITRYSMLLFFVSIASASYAQPMLEEIVVTAEKRETSLQDTPIAITAFTSDEITRDRLVDFSGLALKTPNLVFGEVAGYSQITLRGVGTDVPNLAEAAVATYIDNVWQGQTYTQTTPSFDLERIEVLRGPQGTLYGRNATGGSINLITKLPHEEPEFNAALTVEDYDRQKYELGGNLPLTDNAALRASLTYDDQGEGYRDNVVTGEDQDTIESLSARASFLWDASDSVQVVLRGDYLDTERTGPEYELIGIAPTPAGVTPYNPDGFLNIPNPALGGLTLAEVFGLDTFEPRPESPADPDDLEYTTGLPLLREQDIWGGSATISWDINDSMMFKSITALRESEYDLIHDADGTDFVTVHIDSYAKAEQFTQEFNLSGSTENLQWIVGYFYMQEDAEFLASVDFRDSQTFFEAAIGLGSTGAPLPPGSLAAFGVMLDGTTSATPFIQFDVDQESSSHAVFAQGTYDLNEEISLTAGIRWTEDKKEVVRTTASNLGISCFDAEEDETWSETTGTVGVDYRPGGGDALYYGKISTGFKAGGYNVSSCTGSFLPETLTAFEIGTKNQFFDNRLQVNAAAFFYEYKDIQIVRFVGNTGRIDNAASADIFGAEVEYIALLGESFRIDGSVSYLNSEYGDTLFGDPIDLTAPARNIEGNDAVRAPEWSATIGAEYTWTLAGGDLNLRVDVNWKDNFYFDVHNASLPNQSALEQEAFYIANLRLGWTSEDHTWQVQGFVENLTDEIYSEGANAVGSTGSIIGTFSRPRTFGVRLAYSY